MKHLKRILSLLVILAMLLTVVPGSVFAMEAQKDYTVMIYMVGSDLESSLTGGCASTDIMEMVTSGVDFNNVNVLVYTGGSNRWHLDIPNNKNSVLLLNESGFDIVASTNSNVNMAESAAMTDFLQFAYTNYPADHYSLICWDHGGGPMLGFGSDEIFGGDLLTLYELESALAASPFGPGNKLDWMGFDACLMGSLEIADTVSQYADYLVASEESEPGCGWGYNFLSTLNETSDPVTICRSIIDSYSVHTAEYENMCSYDFDCTLSCMDLSQVDGTIAALEPVWGAMTTTVQTGGFSSMAQIRTTTKEFETGYDLIDLNDMAQQLSYLYPTETAALQAQIQNLVIHQYADISNTAGVTIYYPYNNMDYYLYDWGYVADGMMDSATNYYAYLDTFVSYWSQSTSRGSFLTRSSLNVDAPDEFTMELTQEQVDNLARAYYVILEKDSSSDGYSPVLTNVAIKPDSNNTLHISYNQDLFYCYTNDSTEGTPWLVSQVKEEANRTIYTTQNTRLYASTDFNYYGYGAIQDVSASFYTIDQSSDAILMSVNTESDDLAMGKSDISVEGWGAIGYYVTDFLIPTYDTDGQLLPYTQWESNGWTGSVSMPISDSFLFKKQPMSLYDGEFICQILLEDVSGNVYASELVTFPESEDETMSEKTPNGEMTFTVAGEHAVLSEYQGTDAHVEIPSEINGLPVTEIGKNAFFHQSETAAFSPVNDNETLESLVIPTSVTSIGSGAFQNITSLKSVTFSSGLISIGHAAFNRCSSLTELVFPDTLTTIDSYAFSGCSSLMTVSLPTSLAKLGTGAFAGNRAMEAYLLSETNQAYTVQDGVLFTKNLTELVSYPGSKGNTYAIPDGVQVVGPYAFTGASKNLTNVSFPTTLETIEYFAFFGCDALTELSFPDSLSSIGNSAFHVSFWSDASPSLPVSIGANLSYIGGNAFTGSATSYAVSTENDNFSANDGFLLNHSGDTLLACPSGLTGSVTIPEGVVTIAAEALSDCDSITELVFPDSLVSIDARAGVPSNLISVTIGKNLTNWANIHDFQLVSEIILSEENPAYTMVDGVIYTKDMTQLLIYPLSKFSEHYVVPEGVISIAYGFSGNTFLKALELPSTLEDLGSFNGYSWLNGLENLESVTFTGKNPWYSSTDGLIYEDDTLIFCPSGKSGTITVREDTATIGSGAFGWYVKASEIILPDSVTWIQENNFSNAHKYHGLDEAPLELYLPDSIQQISPEAFQYSPNVNIHCSSGSYAENFCNELTLNTIVQ